MDGYETTKHIRKAESKKQKAEGRRQKAEGRGQKTEDCGQEAENEGLQSTIDNQQSTIRTPIIALTASAFEEERSAALSIGFDDFLRKPFKEFELFETMHKHLGVRYVYEENMSEQALLEITANTLTPDVLATLPTALLQNLEHAASTTDIAKIALLIDEIRPYSSVAADVLSTLANEFEYGKILEMLRQAS